MNKKEFWTLMEQTKDYKTNKDKQNFLIKRLTELGIDELISYETHFQSYYEITYRESLWGAAYVIQGGCSDDDFDYFRAWLIAQGEEVYNNVIKDAEYLADYLEKEGYSTDNYFALDFELLLSVACDTYSIIKTGSDASSTDLFDELYDLIEQQGIKALKKDYEVGDDIVWEDDEDLKDIFPKLWAKYGM